jgi:hypothetical protein
MEICRIVHRKAMPHRQRVGFQIPISGVRWNRNDV